MKNTICFRFLPVSGILLAGLALTAVTAPALYGAPFTVNTTRDRGDIRPGDGVCADDVGNPKCSLRAAIEEINANGGGRIILPAVATSYSLTLGTPLRITANLTVDGEDSSRVHIDGGGITRVLEISPANPEIQQYVDISNVTIQNGTEGSVAGDLYGAGIRIKAGSSLLLQKSTVSGNNSGVGGVGITSYGSLRLMDCTIDKNKVRGDGGGVTGLGAGILILRGDAWIIHGTITNNEAIYGGGIANLGRLRILDGSTLSGNTASEGGAIFNGGGDSNGGYLVINDSIIRDNRWRDTGPRSHPFSLWNGGAISNRSESGIARLDINKCEISYNEAIRGGGVANSNGGIRIINSTISGNSASQGGGIYNLSGDGIEIIFSTITKNRVIDILTSAGRETRRVGGGIANYAQLRMMNTILAQNKQEPDIPPEQACDQNETHCDSPDCFSRRDHSNGIFTSYRNNVVGVLNANCNMRDLSYPLPPIPIYDSWGLPANPLNPRLAPLQNNGGPTFTHALCTASGVPDVSCTGASPAIDRVIWRPGLGECNQTDQRGGRRPAGPACDTGAFELGAFPFPR